MSGYWKKNAIVKTINLYNSGDYSVKTEIISDVDDIEFKDTHVVIYLTRGQIKAFRADHVLTIKTESVHEEFGEGFF